MDRSKPRRRFTEMAMAAGICMTMALLAGCSAEPTNMPASVSSNAQSALEEVFPGNQPAIPNSSSGSAPSTSEEIEMVTAAAEELGVPFNDNIICTIGDPFFSEELGKEVRSISFYEAGELCAGADCSEDGTLVGNFVYY